MVSKDPIQGLDNTTLTAEAEYSIHFWRSKRKFHLSLHHNGRTVFYFVNATKIYLFKAKDSEIKKHPLSLRNISGNLSANNMKKAGIKKCVYDFSVDYKVFDISDITSPPKYLKKKRDIKCLG